MKKQCSIHARNIDVDLDDWESFNVFTFETIPGSPIAVLTDAPEEVVTQAYAEFSENGEDYFHRLLRRHGYFAICGWFGGSCEG